MRSAVFALLCAAPSLVFAAPRARDLAYALKDSHPVPPTWTQLHRAPADETVSLRIGLKQASFAELERHLFEVSHPDHPRYGQHLTNAEVAALVAPSTDALDAVHTWLGANGIDASSIQYSTAKDWLMISLPISDVEALLDTEYHVYENVDGDRVVRTPQYSLPIQLHQYIDLVQPTNYFGNPRALARPFKLSSEQPEGADEVLELVDPNYRRNVVKKREVEGYVARPEGYVAKDVAEGYVAKHEGYVARPEGYVAKNVAEGYVAKHEGYVARPEGYVAKNVAEGYVAKPEGYVARHHDGYVANDVADGYVARPEGYVARPEGYVAKNVAEGYVARPEGYVARHHDGYVANDVSDGYVARPEGHVARPEGYVAKDVVDGYVARPEGYVARHHDGYVARPEGYVARPEGYVAKNVAEGYVARPEGYVAKDFSDGYVARPVGDGYVARPGKDGYVAKDFSDGYVAKDVNDGYVARPSSDGYVASPNTHKGYVRSDARRITEGYVHVAPQPAAGTAFGGVCNASAVTNECLRTLYGTINYTPQVPEKNSAALTAFLHETANISDFRIFLSQQRPDAPSDYLFGYTTIAGGADDQNPINRTERHHGLDEEANLDSQTLGGIIAPTNLHVYSTGGSPPFDPRKKGQKNHNEPYLTWLDYMLTLESPPHTISTSYGDNEQTVPYSYAVRVCQEMAQLGARGVSLFFAAGDAGVGGNHTCYSNDGSNTTMFQPEFPTSCPYITSVGATRNFNPEIVAYDYENGFFGGSGVSNYFPRPSYQEAAVSSYLKSIGNEFAGFYNRTGRAYPDISAQGYHYQITWLGKTIGLDGTSCSTPCATAVLSLINDALIAKGKSPLGFLNPALYSKLYQGFNDITIGSAVGCNTAGFSAAKGWDLASGWGTPNFPKIRALLGV